jgi:hypothetical protein
LVHCWKRNGAGTVRHRNQTPGTTRSYCVGLARCDARNLPEGTATRNWEAPSNTNKTRVAFGPPPIP